MESRHDELIAQVSRELRVPLHAMLGWAQMLLAHERIASEEQLSRGLDIIVRNAKAQARLIDDLIDASSLLEGSLRLAIAPLPVEPVVRAALEPISMAAQAKGVRVTARVEPEGVHVLADGDRLQQVLGSLLDNALKACPPNGAIDVVGRVEDGRACIEIEDDGPGIEDELLPSLFERFRQGKTGRAAKSGLGLGLAIARGLIELHEGVLEVDRGARGARFRVRLPLAVPRRGVDSQRPPPMLQGTSLEGVLEGVRIVIVDDARDAVEPMRVALEQAGASVVVHESAEAALRGMSDQADAADVLIADIRTGEGRSVELLHRLRSLGFAAPAIALTGHNAPRDRLRALQAGFQMHVVKPVDGHELLVTVASVLGKFLPGGR